jgi:AcrR family transcriptional regulator
MRMTTKARRAAPMSPDDRRASILDAAIPLILERGADVTTREIADAAGIAEGTVFRAFPDKNALIDGAVERVMDPADTLAMLGAIDPAQPLEVKVEQIVMLLHSRVGSVVRFMTALGPREHARAKAADHHGHRHPPLGEATDVVVRLLEPDRERLRVSVPAAVDYLRILVFGTSMPFLATGAGSDPSALADFILHGVARDASDA